MASKKEETRQRRKVSIRKKVKGTSERPRLTVFRSSRHISAQVIDDELNKVIVVASTVGKVNQDTFAGKKKTEQAKLIGKNVAEQCLEKGIKTIVFDRNGYKYHGRVLALAKSARESGLSF